MFASRCLCKTRALHNDHKLPLMNKRGRFVWIQNGVIYSTKVYVCVYVFVLALDGRVWDMPRPFGDKVWNGVDSSHFRLGRCPWIPGTCSSPGCGVFNRSWGGYLCGLKCHCIPALLCTGNHSAPL